MTNFKSAALFAVFGFLLASLTGSLRAAPDNTLGMALLAATVSGGTSPSIVRGSGAVSVSRFQQGTYDVVFDRDIANCSCTASAGANALGNYTSQRMTTANCPLTANTVRVMINFEEGSPNDSPFHLIVFCPK